MNPAQTITQSLIKLSPIFKYKVVGSSMSPTLQSGQTILVNRLSYLFKQPEIRDIVALKDPRDKKTLIKRIAKIENNKYFAIGDNKLESTDSRTFGWITKKDIIGKVIIPS